jgi:outer membrane immunogenic protein
MRFPAAHGSKSPDVSGSQIFTLGMTAYELDWDARTWPVCNTCGQIEAIPMVELAESVMLIPNLIIQHVGGVPMRRNFLGLIAALALGSVSSAAMAADMVPPEPVASWTGFYLGAGGGLAWADVNIDHKRCLLDYDGNCDPYEDVFENDSDHSSDPGGVGIVQGGFDYQIGPYYVTGIGADWTFGDVLGDDNHGSHHEDEWGFHDHFDHNDNSMVDVYWRSGFTPLPNLLVFGLGGWTWADIDSNFKVRDDEGDWHHNSDDNFNANGFTLGAGLEWKFADYPLSLRAEYRFTRLEYFHNNDHFTADCGWDECDFRDKNDVQIDVQRVLFTLNWRFAGFGGFGATTAAAY